MEPMIWRGWFHCLKIEHFCFIFRSVYSYMPVFLWKERMNRMGLDSYNELMKLVAERQNGDVDDGKEV